MLAMQDKPGLIQEPTHPDHRRTTINQRNEEVNLLPTTQIIVPNIDLLPSQMTKSQATMVNEATCSTNAVDSLNSNTNTNTIMNSSMSALSNDSNNQISSSRPQSLHSNNSHITVDTNNGPSSPPTSIATPPSSVASTTAMTNTNTNINTNNTSSSTITSSTTTTNCTARTAKRTANDYRFGKTIGEGSFSSVYIAQDIHTKREVASKWRSNLFTYHICVEMP